MPSSSESFGLVALKPPLVRIPVVASAVGGLTSLVASPRTGFVEDRGVDAFAFHVGEILTNGDRPAQHSPSAAVARRDYTWSIAAAVCAASTASSRQSHSSVSLRARPS